MKRPLVYLACGFALSTFMLTKSGFALSAYQIFGFSCVAFLLFYQKNRYLSFLLAGLFMGMCYTNAYQKIIISPVQELSEQTVMVDAIVEGEPTIYEESQRVQVRVLPNQNVSRAFSSLVYFPLDNLQPGDKISAEISFYSPTIYDGFDRREYYHANGIYVLGSSEQIQKIEPANTHRYFPLKAAKSLKNNLSRMIPKRERSVLLAILFGDTSQMSDMDTLALRKAGLSHVVAVSGMHLGFLVGFCILLMGKRWGTVFSIFAILFYIPMVGCTPSVVRAGVMYIIAGLAFLLAKQTDPMQSLCVALLVLLLQNPYAVQNVGLELSFLSTAGLILFAGKLQHQLTGLFSLMPAYKPLRPLFHLICAGISCSFCALVLTTPVLMCSFGYVSVLSPLANIMTLWAVSLIFVIGLSASILFSIFEPLAIALAFLVKWGIRYMLGIISWVSSFPYGLVYWDSIYGKIAVISIYVAIIAFWVVSRIKNHLLLRSIPISLLIVFVCTTALGIQADNRKTTLTALPSGSGQAILVTEGRNKVTLIDCSASGHRNAAQNVREYLMWHGYDHINTVLLTALDKTHARNLSELIHSVPIDAIVIPNKTAEQAFQKECLAAIASANIPVKTPNQVQSSFHNIEMFAQIDRKLGLSIGVGNKKVLIMHSLTQKMLRSFLDENPIQANVLVLSESNLEDAKQLQTAINIVLPDEILLQAGYNDIDKVLGVPVRNTMLEGEISYSS